MNSLIFSVASSEPCDRGWFVEVLKIDENAIDLTRLNGGASVLINHDEDKAVGKVLRAWVEGGKLMVEAQFREADEKTVALFKDLEAGILPNVSIGYQIDKAEKGLTADGKDMVTAVRWTPLEVSVAVGIPADPTVGVQRSLKDTLYRACAVDQPQQKGVCPECGQEPCTCAKAEEPQPEEPQPEPAPQPEESQPEEPVSQPAQGGAAVDDNEPKKQACEPQVRSIILRRQPTMNDNYSPARALQSLLDANVNADFERKISQEMQAKAGIHTNGIMLRAWGGTTGGEGLVGTEARPQEFIEALKKRMGVQGFRAIDGGRAGIIELPVMTESVDPAILALNANATETDPTVAKVQLSPKKFAAYVTVSEDLIWTSAPDALNLVITDAVDQLARKLDTAILAGCASPAIAGVEGTTGVNTHTIASLAATKYSDLTAMYGAVADYELQDNLAWVGKGSTLATLMGITKDAGSGRFLVEDGKALGYDFRVAAGAGADALYLGAWDKVVVCTWGGGPIIETEKKPLDGRVTVCVKLLADIAITQPKAFVKRVQA